MRRGRGDLHQLDPIRVARCAGVGQYTKDVVVKGPLGGNVEGRREDTGGAVVQVCPIR